MPVELRKRKAREPPAPAPVTKKAAPKATKAKATAAAKAKAAKPAPAKKVVEESKEDLTEEEKEEPKKEEPKKEEPKKAEAKKAAKSDKVEVGDIIDLDTFGGEIETNDGETTSLKKLVDESEAGVVLFTYPKASTPGCKLPRSTRLSVLDVSD